MPTRKIVILQSNYIPWKGYFDLIAAADAFIFYDDVQFTKNDWRNRNRIKTPKGPEWISIPVGQDIRRRVCDVDLPQTDWRETHWRTLENNYHRAPCFREIASLLEPHYRGAPAPAFLSLFNAGLIRTICEYLGIATPLTWSTDYQLAEGRTVRLVDLCRQVDGDEYLSGPAAKSYLDEAAFNAAGIQVTWFDYTGYPEYPQLWGNFVHEVSVLDLLFNCGQKTAAYMKHVRR